MSVEKEGNLPRSRSTSFLMTSTRNPSPFSSVHSTTSHLYSPAFPHTLSYRSMQQNVAGSSWAAALSTKRSNTVGAVSRRKSSVYSPDSHAHLTEKSSAAWIERVFQKRECIKFMPEEKSDRCGCGRLSSSHSQLALSRFTTSVTRPTLYSAQPQKWTINAHTIGSPTDAFGIIEFQGGAHAHKAHYLRLAFDSNPADVVYLMEKVWNLQRPRLIITIHGGMTNFKVADKLGRLFREGMLKAAETTGAWILTAGVDSGVVRHVARALDEAGISARMRSKVVTIGIAPWGLLRRREKLVGREANIQYDRHCFLSRSRNAVLNDHHSYFLLVDNGTVGRYGADIVLRKRFEDFLAKKQTLYCSSSSHRIPIVCVGLEGGLCTLNSIHLYLTAQPATPVIICEGSGRISDFLALAERCQDEKGQLPEGMRLQLLQSIRHTLCSDNISAAETVLLKIMECVRFKGLLTVFRLNEDSYNDVDHVILRALLKGQNLSPADQLSLALAWDRVDIARSEIFQDGQDWPMASLHSAMLEALLLNRVQFIKLLLENGVSPKKFLTIGRLEQLYNSEPGHLSTLYHLIGDKTSQKLEDGQGFTLPEIGVAMEKLIGNAYRCYYTTRSFRSRYDNYKGKSQLKRSASISNLHLRLTTSGGLGGSTKRGQPEHSTVDTDFRHPFNDLMLWAILTRRHEMAKCMWQHGEEAMAKALTAIRLYKCMSKEAADDYTEVEVSNQLREYANDFRECSFELLSHCYQHDDLMTMRLLTAELPNWGHHTCLSLAVIANNKRFLAHPCCQILLAELWHGGLRFRSQSNVKVVLAVLFPPTILLLDFKTSAQQKAKGSRRVVRSADESDTTDHYFKEDDDLEEEKGVGSLVSTHISALFNNRKNSISRLLSSRKGSRCVEGEGGQKEKKTDLLLPAQDYHPQNTAGKRVQIVTSRAVSQEDLNLLSRKISSTTGSSLHIGTKVWKTRLSECLAKFISFYGAPITSFWIWSLSFALFMLLLIYVLLVEFPPEVGYVEWLLFAYVLGLGMEHFRKLLILESSSFMEKMGVFYNRYWNILTTVAVLTYFLGFALRFHKPAVHTYSRVILASNSLLWHMKLFDFLSVHPRIGPYITMAGKMILAMSYIIVMLLVTLMAFGVVRQSITFPHEKWNWILVRNIFYKPYFMLYGEVYAGEVDTCGDEGTNCVPGGWIPPFVMVVFLLVANILLINMLIAIFNNIFNVTNAMSQQVWMFQRYEQVLEYKSTPIIPPPLTPLVHLLMLGRHFCRVKPAHSTTEPVKANCSTADFAIKVLLEENELKKLYDFEEDCMDDLCRRKFHSTASLGKQQQLKESLEGLEEVSAKMKELVEENCSLKSNFNQLLGRLDRLQTSQTAILDILKKNRNKGSCIEPSKKSDRSLKVIVGKKLPKARVSPLLEGISSDEVALPTIPPAPIPMQANLQQQAFPVACQPVNKISSSAATSAVYFSVYNEEEKEEEAGECQPCNHPPASIHSPSLHSRQRNSMSLTEDLDQMFLASGLDRLAVQGNVPETVPTTNYCPSILFSEGNQTGSTSTSTSTESLNQVMVEDR